MIKPLLILLLFASVVFGQYRVRPQDLTPETKTLIADSAKAAWNDSVGVLEARALNSAKSAISDTATQLRSEMASPATISDTTTATVRKTVDAQTAWTDDSNDSVYVPDGSTITNSGRTLQVGTIDTSNFNAAIRAYIAKEIRKGILSGLAGQDTTGYWVAKDGNDSNAGNYSYPWLTLNKANTSATKDATVHVKAGTYIENGTGSCMYVNKSLNYVAEGDVYIVGTGTDQVLNAPLNDASTAYFDGFTFLGGDSTTNLIYKSTGDGDLKFTDCKFYSQCATASAKGFYVLGTGALLLDNCYASFDSVDYGFDIRTTGANRIENSRLDFDATVTTGIYLRPTSGSLVTRGNTIISNAPTTFLHSDENTWVIAQNTITQTASVTSLFTVGTKTDGVCKFDSNTVTAAKSTSRWFYEGSQSAGVNYYVRGNRVTFTDATHNINAFEFRDNHVNFSGNTITLPNPSATTAAAFFAYCTDTDIGADTVSNNIIYTKSPSGYAIAIGSEGTTAQDNYLDSTLISGNTIYGPAWYSGSLTSVTIHGIFVGFNRDCTFKYNKVYGCGYGIVDKGSNTSGGIIAYNVFADNWQSIRVKGDTAVAIYNNSIYNNIDFACDGIYLSENAGSDGAINCVIKNNSIQTKTASAQSSYGILIDAASSSGQTIDYNLIKLSSGYIGGYNGATKTWATWQALGFDANGINSDPLYLIPESNNLKLTSRSPGINAGTDVSETVDIDGNSISGNPDIGAYKKQ